MPKNYPSVANSDTPAPENKKRSKKEKHPKPEVEVKMESEELPNQKKLESEGEVRPPIRGGKSLIKYYLFVCFFRKENKVFLSLLVTIFSEI
jgi:hypothetical protein